MSTAAETYTTYEAEMPEQAPYVKLNQRLLAAFKEIGAVDKTGRNEDQHYTYQKASDVAATVRVVLAKNGLFPEVKAENRQQYEVTTKNGKVMNGERVDMYVRFVDAETGARSQWYPGFASSLATDDKAIFKAMTTGMKYALRNAFLIPDGKDDVENDSKLQEALNEAVVEEKLQAVFGTLVAHSQFKGETWFKMHDPMTNTNFHVRAPQGTEYAEMIGAIGAPIGVRAVPESNDQKGERVFRLASVVKVGDVPGKEEDPTFLPDHPVSVKSVREAANAELQAQIGGRMANSDNNTEPIPTDYTPSQQLMEDAKRAQEKIQRFTKNYGLKAASETSPDFATEPQQKLIRWVASEIGAGEKGLTELLGAWGYESLEELPKKRVNEFIRQLDPENQSGKAGPDNFKWKTRKTR